MRPPPGAPWPTATTRPVVLLGWPARYSLSPVLHNAAFREHDFDLVYLVWPTLPEDLAGAVAQLAKAGAVGANVTIPHKAAAYALCDGLSDEARLVGVVNTLTFTPAGVHGDNTDAVGLRDALVTDVGLPPGARVVVLGTGGAARAAVVAAGRLGALVTVVGRDGEAASKLALLSVEAGAVRADGHRLGDTDVAHAVGAADLVMNATPLGMSGEELPEPFMALRAEQVAYDLVYDPAETPFLRAALEAGARAHHGLAMLVAQAAASYERWTGQPAPTGVMSAAALGALRAGDAAGA